MEHLEVEELDQSVGAGKPALNAVSVSITTKPFRSYLQVNIT